MAHLSGKVRSLGERARAYLSVKILLFQLSFGFRNSVRPKRLTAWFLAAALAACSSAEVATTPPRQEPSPTATQEPLEWRQLAPVPTPRTEVAAAAAAGKIYVAGGFAEGAGTVATVEVYDVAADSWSRGPPLPVAVNHAMAAAVGGEPYVVGGYLGPGLSNPTSRAFVLREGEWQELPRMPGARGAGGAARARGKLFVVGGVTPNGLATSTFVYNPETNAWRTRRGMPTDRQHLGVAGHGGRIYAVAGRIGGFTTNLDAAERFNPVRRRWRALPDVPTARGGVAAAGTTNGFIVAAGGEANEGTFDEVEAFNVETGRWRSLPPMPTARHGLGVVAVGTVIYVLAGGPEPGLTFSNANESLDLSGL
jgi:N-acetylneuraminic acid mutarotase